MNIRQAAIAATLSTVTAACGCISDATQAADQNPKAGLTAQDQSPSATEKIREPQIQAEWQKKFIEIFQKDFPMAKTAVALFSYGGWANDGQVIVIGDAGKEGTVLYAKPGSKAVDSKKTLTANELDKFSSGLAGAATLTDLETGVMDGLQFEYVKAVKDESGKVRIVQRVFMNNPGVSKPAPGHTDIVAKFAEFKPKPKG